MRKISTQSGFTLIELMVSLSLFIIIVMALVGSLYTVNDASRKVQAMRTVMDNLNFAMESISRTVRTSENISVTCTVGTQCWVDTQGGSQISMHSTLGDRQLVRYQVVRPGGKNGAIQKQTAPIDENGVVHYDQLTAWQSITSPEIDIEKAAFFSRGTGINDGQPAIVVRVEGTASVKGSTVIPFAVQTYLSQRTPELP